MLVHLYSIVINVLMFLNILVYYIIILYYYVIILFVYCLLYYYIIILLYSYITILLYYLCIVLFSYAIKKCSKIFKYFFYIIVHSTCCYFCICYSSMLKYLCIPQTWPYHWNFKFNLVIIVLCSMCVIIYFNSLFCPKFSCLIWFNV